MGFRMRLLQGRRQSASSRRGVTFLPLPEKGRRGYSEPLGPRKNIGMKHDSEVACSHTERPLSGGSGS